MCNNEPQKFEQKSFLKYFNTEFLILNVTYFCEFLRSSQFSAFFKSVSL